MAAEPDTRNMREASDVAATHPAILLWTDSKQPALLIAEVDIDAATCPLLHGGAEVVDVLASQLDQYSAQRRWIVNRVVAAADRSLAVLVNEVKYPTFVALEVESTNRRIGKEYSACLWMPLRSIRGLHGPVESAPAAGLESSCGRSVCPTMSSSATPARKHS
jgi:hypothetical protein